MNQEAFAGNPGGDAEEWIKRQATWVRWTDGTEGYYPVKGTMNSSPDPFAAWGRTRSQAAELSVGEAVAGLGSNVFRETAGLTKVVVSGAAKTVGGAAFYRCRNLSAVELKEGVQKIGGGVYGGAFDYCDLRELSLPDSLTSLNGGYGNPFCGNARLSAASVGEGNPAYAAVGRTVMTKDRKTLVVGVAQGGVAEIPAETETIGRSAFAGRSDLTSVPLPDGLACIDADAFTGCAGLTAVELPESLRRIEHSAFRQSGLVGVEIPDGVSALGEFAFEKCPRLKTVVVGAGVKSVGSCAFQDCAGLAGLTIRDGVEGIEDNAFYYCVGLSSVAIPASVVDVNPAAFRGCGLTEYAVDGGNPAYKSVGGLLLTKDGATLVGGASGPEGRAVVPDGVTSIAVCAFENCAGLTAAAIPEGVENIGFNVFYHCENLKEITLPGSLTSVGNYAFSRCGGLTSLSLPDGVASIEYCAFSQCRGLTSLSLPDSVTSIESHAFYYCSGLTSLSLPDSVASIGNYAFLGCSQISRVEIRPAGGDAELTKADLIQAGVPENAEWIIG